MSFVALRQKTDTAMNIQLSFAAIRYDLGTIKWNLSNLVDYSYLFNGVNMMLNLYGVKDGFSDFFVFMSQYVTREHLLTNICCL